jgi:glycine/D-amino acid oxidase-like deaminating enzyme
MTTTTTDITGERADLLETLGKHRGLLRHTVEGLTDEQAALTPTASELCLGGLIKHVTRMESRWTSFIVDGPSAMAINEDSYAAHAESFRMLPDDTLAEILERYDEAAARTDELVRSLPDLGASQLLPEAPWFPPGAAWSARRTFVHIVAETAQHAGHADILRETIDGQKSMG